MAGSGDDTIDGGGGGDVIGDGGGDDLVAYRGTELSIDGGSGVNTLEIVARGASSVNFADPPASIRSSATTTS